MWTSYKEVEERAIAFGAGLSSLELGTGQDSMLGIYSPNNIAVMSVCMCCVVLLLSLCSCQWVVSQQSCNCYSRVIVPLYDTLGPDAVSYIINLGKLPPALAYF